MPIEQWQTKGAAGQRREEAVEIEISEVQPFVGINSPQWLCANPPFDIRASRHQDGPRCCTLMLFHLRDEKLKTIVSILYFCLSKASQQVSK